MNPKNIECVIFCQVLSHKVPKVPPAPPACCILVIIRNPKTTLSTTELVDRILLYVEYHSKFQMLSFWIFLVWSWGFHPAEHFTSKLKWRLFFWVTHQAPPVFCGWQTRTQVLLGRAFHCMHICTSLSGKLVDSRHLSLSDSSFHAFHLWRVPFTH